MTKSNNIVTVLFSVFLCIMFALSFLDTVEIRCKTNFDYNKITTHIVKICENGPHSISDTQENLSVMEYIISQIKECGVVCENTTDKPAYLLQNFEFLPRGTQSYNLNNIIVHIPANSSSPSNEAVMIMAHYDSVECGEGACDDASACSVMLEAIRYYLNIMNNGYIISNDLVFCFTNGEEEGRQGSKAFIKDFDRFGDITKRIKFAINIDAGGTSGTQIMYETSENNYNTIKLFSEVNENLFTSSAAVGIYNTMSNNSDFSSFKDIYQGVNIANTCGGENYHTQNDNPENISEISVSQQAKIIDDLIRKLADYDLDTLYESDDSAIFFSYLNIGTIFYSHTTAIVFAAIGMVLLIANIILSTANCKEKIIKKAFRSLISIIASLFFTAAAAYGCYYLFQIIAILTGTIDILAFGQIEFCNTVLNIGIVFLVIAVTSLVSYLSCKIFKLTRRDLICTFAYVHTAIGIVMSFVLVEESYVFIFSGIMLMINELIVTCSKKSSISQYHFELLVMGLYMPLCVPVVFVTQSIGLGKSFITGILWVLAIFPVGINIVPLCRYFSLRTVIRILKKKELILSSKRGFLYVFAVPMMIFLSVSLTTPSPNSCLSQKHTESPIIDDSLNYEIWYGQSDHISPEKKYVYRIYDIYAYNALKKYVPGLKRTEDFYECRAPKKDIGLSILSHADKNKLTITKADEKSKIYVYFMNATAKSFSIDDGKEIRNIDFNEHGFGFFTFRSNCTVTINDGSAYIQYNELIRDFKPIIPESYKAGRDRFHFNLMLENEYFLSE